MAGAITRRARRVVYDLYDGHDLVESDVAYYGDAQLGRLANMIRKQLGNPLVTIKVKRDERLEGTMTYEKFFEHADVEVKE